jgi:cadmium resistance protein CadD (predicted permease)
MITAILLSIGTFLATNIDDLVLLMVFASEEKGNKIANRHIWIGQFLSIGLIILLGLSGAWLFRFLPADFDSYIKWIGLLPIGLGLYHLLFTLIGQREKRRQRHREKIKKIKKIDAKNDDTTVWRVFSLLFLAGVDNIGVYIPLFLGMTLITKYISLGVFTLLTALICLLAIVLSTNNTIAKAVQKTEVFLVPIILIVIGVAVIFGVG